VKKVKFELADTTFRARRKKNGAITLHLKTYLLLHADADFHSKIKEAYPKWSEIIAGTIGPRGLSAFLNGRPRCWLRLPDKKEKECELFVKVCRLNKSQEAYCAPLFLKILLTRNLGFICSGQR